MTPILSWLRAHPILALLFAVAITSTACGLALVWVAGVKPERIDWVLVAALVAVMGWMVAITRLKP